MVYGGTIKAKCQIYCFNTFTSSSRLKLFMASNYHIKEKLLAYKCPHAVVILAYFFVIAIKL